MEYFKSAPGWIGDLRRRDCCNYYSVVFAKVKGLSFPRLADTAGLGLILGQIIGRWGNFFNREAFGGYTDGLLAMQLPVSAVRDSDISKELAEHIVEIGGVSYIQVHPISFVRSLWSELW